MSRTKQSDRQRRGRRHGEAVSSRSGSDAPRRSSSRSVAAGSNSRVKGNSETRSSERRSDRSEHRTRESVRAGGPDDGQVLGGNDWEIAADEPWNLSRRARRRAERDKVGSNSRRNSSGKGSQTSTRNAPGSKQSKKHVSTDQRRADRKTANAKSAGRKSVDRKTDRRSKASQARTRPAHTKRPDRGAGVAVGSGSPSTPAKRTAKQHDALQINPNQRGRTAKRRGDARFSVGHSKPRLWAMIVLIAGVLILVLGQVIKLQTSGGEVLRAEGENQWSRSRVLPATRGTIFDRDGQEMAISIPAASVSIDPKRIENPDQVMALLTEVVGIDADQQAKVAAAIAAKDRSFVYVERQIPLDVGERLFKLVSNRGVKGIHVDWEDKRILPGGTTGQSVIGLTDIDGVGVSGLELKYGGADSGTDRGFTDVLSGTAGRSTRAIAPDGSTVVGTEQVTVEPVPGRDLMLTIDRSVQYAVEKVLVDQVAKLGTKGGQVIVLDTKTGETIAMASVVRNPKTDEVEVTARNSAAVDAYEPGSVVKAITVAAALNERSVTPETTFTVPWRKQFADDWLRDAAQHPDQEMTVRDILVHSSNIGTIMIKEGMADVPEVARRIHWNYMREFGLGERTAIEFPGESPGILKDWDELWGSERATVSYGQGVSSTSIQLIAAINVIANDGTYVVPSLVKGLIDESGKLESAEPAATHEVVRPEVAEQMHAIMRSVVCSGTAKLAQQGIDNYAIAGKTGTGYKAQPNGTYVNADGDYTYYASFVGFFPLDDPQITMLVSIDEPPADSVDRFGGTAAAPVFAELVPTVAQAMRIPPRPGSGECDDSTVAQ